MHVASVWCGLPPCPRIIMGMHSWTMEKVSSLCWHDVASGMWRVPCAYSRLACAGPDSTAVACKYQCGCAMLKFFFAVITEYLEMGAVCKCNLHALFCFKASSSKYRVQQKNLFWDSTYLKFKHAVIRAQMGILCRARATRPSLRGRPRW